MNPKLSVALLALLIILGSLSCTSGSNMPGSSELQPRTSPVQVGETAPNFTLEAQNGQRISLAEARGNSPIVLVFYRGNW